MDNGQTIVSVPLLDKREHNYLQAIRDPDLDLNSKGVMAFLFHATHGAGATATDIIAGSGSTHPTIKKCFAKLENDGYIKRIPPEKLQDRRKVLYKISTEPK